MWWFFCEGYGDHRDLHVLTHSFPTRRSSDLAWGLTAHWAIWANHNLLLLDPLCLLLVPAWLMSARATWRPRRWQRSEEHTSELQSLMRISYAVFCLKKKILLKKLTTIIVESQ